MTGSLKVLDSSGHTTTEWDVAEPRTVQEAEKEFNRLMAFNGFLAYSVEAPGKARQIREFEPEATEIIVHQPLVGG